MAWRNSSGGQGGAACIAVPGFGRKFWTITSCTWPWRRCAAAMASSASMRSATVSPMPTRIPVVNGICSSPGGLEGGQPPGRGLVGRAAVAVEVVAERLDHHPLAGRDGAQRGPGRRSIEGAGVGVGEQPGLVEHERGHRRQVLDRRRVAVLVEPRPGHRVAVLRALAEREQRLVAAGGRARPGRCAAPARASRYGDSSRAGGWAKVQYPHRSRHSIVSGMNTFGEKVTREPWASSRTARARAIRWRAGGRRGRQHRLGGHLAGAWRHPIVGLERQISRRRRGRRSRRPCRR